MVKKFVINGARDIIYFPVWWYTVGSVKILKTIRQDALDLAKRLNLSILFKYLFKPMYGMTDFWSRIISFMVRAGHLFGLTFITFIWIIMLGFMFVIWLVLPVFVIFNILIQLKIISF